MIEHDVAYGLEKAIELAPNDGCPITLTIGECESLVSRLRQSEKDAARYRWLLDNCTTQQADTMGPTFVMTIRRKNNLFNVGLSIDEAMKCSGDDE